MRSYVVRLLPMLALLSACGGSNPVAVGPGSASVWGAVYAPDASLIPNIGIFVTCGGSGSVLGTSADSTGHYGINLTASDSLMAATGGSIPCEFQASQPSGAKLDTSMNVPFGVDGTPQALRLIDLYLH